MAIELTKADCMSWRKFLGTEAGTNGMLFLRERAPLIQKGDMESMLHDGGRVEGHRRVLDMISDIIAAEPKKNDNIESI